MWSKKSLHSILEFKYGKERKIYKRNRCEVFSLWSFIVSRVTFWTEGLQYFRSAAWIRKNYLLSSWRHWLTPPSARYVWDYIFLLFRYIITACYKYIKQINYLFYYVSYFKVIVLQMSYFAFLSLIYKTGFYFLHREIGLCSVETERLLKKTILKYI